jgi:hypothetical protein
LYSRLDSSGERNFLRKAGAYMFGVHPPDLAGRVFPQTISGPFLSEFRGIARNVGGK